MEKNPIKTLLTNPSNDSYEGYVLWTNVYIIFLASEDAPNKIFSVVLTSTYYLLFYVEQKIEINLSQNNLTCSSQ